MTARHFNADESHSLRLHFARALGGRLTVTPEYIKRKINRRISRHSFSLRLPQGLVIWYECWCDNESVIEAMRESASFLANEGFTVTFLKTCFSTRWVGKRQPLLVVPPKSTVDFDHVVERLKLAIREIPK